MVRTEHVGYPDRTQAEAAERDSIREEKPLHNITRGYTTVTDKESGAYISHEVAEADGWARSDIYLGEPITAENIDKFFPPPTQADYDWNQYIKSRMTQEQEEAYMGSDEYFRRSEGSGGSGWKIAGGRKVYAKEQP